MDYSTTLKYCSKRPFAKVQKINPLRYFTAVYNVYVSRRFWLLLFLHRGPKPVTIPIFSSHCITLRHLQTIQGSSLRRPNVEASGNISLPTVWEWENSPPRGLWNVEWPPSKLFRKAASSPPLQWIMAPSWAESLVVIPATTRTIPPSALPGPHELTRGRRVMNSSTTISMNMTPNWAQEAGRHR